MPDIRNHYCTFGCDPELFLEKAGKVIGSERALPEKGIKYDSDGRIRGSSEGSIVRDGVQIELNPAPNGCRANLSNTIQASFRALKEQLSKMEGVKASFASVVTVPKKELDALSEASRVLGCAPSKNVYNKKATIKVSKANLRKRAAGGHIHIGLDSAMKKTVQENPDRLAILMDILVGNTCVMIDRDPMAARRRQVYGKAGEYRLPPHGLEYRTLSNFWLRSYPLMSMVMGLTRIAVSTLGSSLPNTYGYPKFDFEGELIKRVDLKKIQKAINKNDLALAEENWAGVKEWIKAHAPYLGDGSAVCKTSIPEFEHFLSKIKSNGIEYWFPDDPFTHWCNKPEGHQNGFESWLNRTVKEDMLKAQKEATA